MKRLPIKWSFFALLLPLLTSLSPASAIAGNQIDLNAVSEEDPPAVCPRGYVVKGIRCSGGYCDNKSLRCQRYRYIDPSYHWSDWFSEEDGKQTSSSGFVSGLACSGSWCDNLRLQFVEDPGLKNSGSCRQTKRFSEEQGYRECYRGYYISGLKCYGKYCDDIKLYCCRPE